MDFFPPRFNGKGNSDPLAHWLSWDDYSTAHKLSDADKIEKFKISLVDTARLWINNQEFANPNALKTAFFNHFSGVHSRDGALELWEKAAWIKPEAIATFLARIKSIDERLDYNDRQIQDKFILGLPQDIKIHAVMADGNLADTVKTAQKHADMTHQNSALGTKEMSFVSRDVQFKTTGVEEKIDKIEGMLEKVSFAGEHKSRDQTPGRQWDSTR